MWLFHWLFDPAGLYKDFEIIFKFLHVDAYKIFPFGETT